MIAVIAGFTFSLLEINIPDIPNVIFIMLAGAAAPTALFALGITLISKNIYSSFSEIFSITVIKLIIHPLLVTLLLSEWYFKNTTSNTIWIQTAILSACLPIAANVYSMSEFYQKYVTLTAAAITFTTVVASISVTIFLYLLYDLETYLLFLEKLFTSFQNPDIRDAAKIILRKSPYMKGYRPISRVLVKFIFSKFCK